MTAPIPMLVLLSRRDAITPDDFRAYWQDVHGPLAARLPGLHHYRQLHVAPQRGWWPETPGLDVEPSAVDRIDGIADMAFASREGQQAYAAVAHFTRNDEVNVFRRSLRYLVDERAGSVGADDAANAFHLCALLRRQPGVETPAFVQGLRGLFAQQQATVWMLQPPDNTQNHLLSAHVDHDAPSERQYDALVEVRFASAFDARRFFTHDSFVAGQQSLLAAAHVYRIAHVAPMLLEGRMTLGGRRGHTVAQLIERVGALNQLDDAVAARFGERPGSN